MKALKHIALLTVGVAAMSLASCDAVWTDSADGYVPGYYGVGISSDWYPSLPGAPLISPVYWGNQLYPGSILPPPVRPPYRPVGPIIGGNAPTRPGGNVRPGVTPPANPAPTPSVPATPLKPAQPIVPPSGSIPPSQVTGGQPGVAMPPAGSGMRPTTSGRH